MTETSPIAARIRERLASLGLSVRAAASRAGSPESTIRNILEGKSESPRGTTLTKLAKALDVSEQWLLTGQQPPEFTPAEVELPEPGSMPKDLPVYGSAMGSVIDAGFEGIEIFSTMPADYVRRPPALSRVPDAYAIYVSGDSMHPMHPHGALRMVHPHRPVAPGDSVIVQTRSWEDAPAQGYIKILRRRNGDRVILEQLNPPTVIEIPLQSVISIHKVLELNDLFGV